MSASDSRGESTGQTVELDAALLREAQRGDPKAFTALVRQYEQVAYSFAYKVCRDQEKAAETLQDTFVNVYRKIGQFNRRSKFTTWLYSIVVNNCRMKHRRTQLDRMTASLDEVEPPHGGDGRAGEHPAGRSVAAWKSTPLDRVMKNELRALLDDAINRLPLDYRTVFVLRDIEGQSAAATAHILGLSVPAVKSRLRRARVFLREQLSEYMTS